MITTPDSPEISFHRNSVQNVDIDALAVCTLVTFNEVEGLWWGAGRLWIHGIWENEEVSEMRLRFAPQGARQWLATLGCLLVLMVVIMSSLLALLKIPGSSYTGSPAETECCREPPFFVRGVGWSDHWSFWAEGYPAIMVTDTAFIVMLPTIPPMTPRRSSTMNVWPAWSAVWHPPFWSWPLQTLSKLLVPQLRDMP